MKRMLPVILLFLFSAIGGRVYGLDVLSYQLGGSYDETKQKVRDTYNLFYNFGPDNLHFGDDMLTKWANNLRVSVCPGANYDGKIFKIFSLEHFSSSSADELTKLLQKHREYFGKMVGSNMQSVMEVKTEKDDSSASGHKIMVLLKSGETWELGIFVKKKYKIVTLQLERENKSICSDSEEAEKKSDLDQKADVAQEAGDVSGFDAIVGEWIGYEDQEDSFTIDATGQLCYREPGKEDCDDLTLKALGNNRYQLVEEDDVIFEFDGNVIVATDGGVKFNSYKRDLSELDQKFEESVKELVRVIIEEEEYPKEFAAIGPCVVSKSGELPDQSKEIFVKFFTGHGSSFSEFSDAVEALEKNGNSKELDLLDELEEFFETCAKELGLEG